MVTGETDDDYLVLTDIQGLEDFFGDMDFKVGGTHKGITAIQVDMKVHGISYDVIRSALDKTYKARCYILDEIMLKAIPEVRPELSKYAPKMLTLMVHIVISRAAYYTDCLHVFQAFKGKKIILKVMHIRNETAR